jgi:hypothetical protein
MVVFLTDFSMAITCLVQRESTSLQQKDWSNWKIQLGIIKLRSRIRLQREIILRLTASPQVNLTSSNLKAESSTTTSLIESQRNSMTKFFIKTWKSLPSRWEVTLRVNSLKDQL